MGVFERAAKDAERRATPPYEGKAPASDTPAKKSERVRGSSRNPKGSASSAKQGEGIELGEQIDGHFYAPAAFYIKKFDVSTWNSILKKDATLRYKGDPRKGLYTISAKLIKGRANSWYGPALAAAGNTPDKVYDFVVTQLSQPLA